MNLENWYLQLGNFEILNENQIISGKGNRELL
jgi:hypothetical protein